MRLNSSELTAQLKTDRYLLIKLNFLNYPYITASQNKARLMRCIFWDLTLEKKLNIFSISDEETDFNNFPLQRTEIWICLLVSPFYECVLDDILNFPISISTEIYGQVLSYLTFKMTKSNILTGKEIKKKNCGAAFQLNKKSKFSKWENT